MKNNEKCDKKIKVLTLNWGHGPYSISKIIRDVESVLMNEVEFLHVQETDFSKRQIKWSNLVSLSNWFEYRMYYVISMLTGNQYGVGNIPYWKFVHIVRKFKPDVVHIHCPNAHSINIYKVLHFLKKTGMPTVVSNHAEFFYTGCCSHAEECILFMSGCVGCRRFGHGLGQPNAEKSWKKMQEAFAGFYRLRMVAVSPWVVERIKKSPIANGIPVDVVLNGINVDIFNYQKTEKSANCNKLVLHVTAGFPDNENKGGKYVLDLAQKCGNLPIDFVIVGGSNLTQEEVPENVKIIGEISDQNSLAEYYRNADLTLITSKRETYGMTCVESLCCGTPVVGFENGGTESIAIPEYTQFVPFGEVDILKEEMQRMLGYDFNHNKIAEDAKEIYSKEKMAKAYFEVYRKVLGEVE